MTKEERIRRYKEFMWEAESIPAEYLESLGFFDAPASIRYHSPHEGGLFEHSITVAEELVKLTKKLELKWERPDSPYVIGMYHDLCKCDAYIWDEEKESYSFNNSIIIPGHGDKSAIMASRCLTLTDEEIACIRWHMGAYEKDPKMWEYYGRAVEKYPNVLYTHTADMIASRIQGI